MLLYIPRLSLVVPILLHLKQPESFSSEVHPSEPLLLIEHFIIGLLVIRPLDSYLNAQLGPLYFRCLLYEPVLRDPISRFLVERVIRRDPWSYRFRKELLVEIPLDILF